jgi:hypothetical protein
MEKDKVFLDEEDSISRDIPKRTSGNLREPPGSGLDGLLPKSTKVRNKN